VLRRYHHKLNGLTRIPSKLRNLKERLIRIATRIICIGLFGSCLSPINIETENKGGVLTVTGQVSTISEQNSIQLGLSAETERLPFPLSGAYVALVDDLGNTFPYSEDALFPGNYLLPGFAGIPEVTYHVKIVLPSGEIYESVPEKMPSYTGPFTTTFEIVDEEFTDFEGTVLLKPFVKIYTDVDPASVEQAKFLKWNIQEDFLLSPTDFPDPFNAIPPPCYITQNADPQKINIVASDDVARTSTEQLLIGSRIVDWSFLERHYFTTYQSTMTREAYEYWRKVDILANQVGSIFDTPPAYIVGNVANVNDPGERVLGYFQAVNQTFDRFYTLPFTFPFPLTMEPCTYYSYKYTYLPRCLDCTSVRNSSYRRPDWF